MLDCICHQMSALHAAEPQTAEELAAAAMSEVGLSEGDEARRRWAAALDQQAVERSLALAAGDSASDPGCEMPALLDTEPDWSNVL